METEYFYLMAFAWVVPLVFWMSYKRLSNGSQPAKNATGKSASQPNTTRIIELNLDNSCIDQFHLYDDVAVIYQKFGQPEYQNPQTPQHLYYPKQGLEIELDQQKIDSVYLFINPDLSIRSTHQQHPFNSCPVMIIHKRKVRELSPTITRQQLINLLDEQATPTSTQAEKKPYVYITPCAYVHPTFKQNHPNSKGKLHLRCEFDFDRFDRLLGIWISYIYA